MVPMAAVARVENAAVRQSFLSLAIAMVIMGVLLFAPAGTLHWPRGWWFGGTFLAATLIAISVLWRVNPEIFAARSRIQPGTKTRDYVYIAIVMGGFILILPVAAIDFRFGWTQMPDWVVWFGYLLFVLSFAGQVWPQAVNRHFEPGVRIQQDRAQTVIDTGPYAIVRHPGYISGSLLAISIALCLGAQWALAPAIVVVIGLISRTLFEERVLTTELSGYREYTQRVKYRWVPGVW
jgi:protein-S-isoprenylcysteine O-methyltransferase Ste14